MSRSPSLKFELAARLARRRVALGFLTAAAVLIFSMPMWTSWMIGCVVAVAGEALRLWAAGHLEKSREVTSSGPYGWMRHPLYVGSSLIALGVAIAAHSLLAAVLIAVYVVVTIGSAVRTEEAFLRDAFGEAYDRYRRSETAPLDRRFSLERAARNREPRTVAGLAGGFALLALKIVLPI